MTDALARAAASGLTTEIGGKKYTVSPITLQQLQQLQRDALTHYKRQYLETFSSNADLLGDVAADILTKKIEEAARWDIGDLPSKTAYDVKGVKVNDKLKVLLAKFFDDLPDEESEVRDLLSTALIAGDIKPEEVKAATGTRPRKTMIPFDAWWITSTYEGIISLVWASLTIEQPDLTRVQVGGWPITQLTLVAHTIEKITQPMVGNT